MISLDAPQRHFVQANIAGFDDTWITESAGSAGSDRRFIRVASPDRSRSEVLILWNAADPDWDRFFAIGEELSRFHTILPAICARDDAGGMVLVEDLGPHTLHQLLGEPGSDPLALYRRVIDRLVQWQSVPVGRCRSLSSRALDRDMYLWETGYFAEKCVGDLFGLGDILGPDFESERTILAERAAAYEQVCLHRDFQSENVMFTGGVVRFVDFQGSRLGAPWYDLASLIFDPYTASILTHRNRLMLAAYWHETAKRPWEPEALTDCAIQRLMQALGAYGNLSVHKGKPRYRAHVAPALGLLAQILAEDTRYPSISAVVSRCCQHLDLINQSIPRSIP